MPIRHLSRYSMTSNNSQKLPTTDRVIKSKPTALSYLSRERASVWSLNIYAPIFSASRYAQVLSLRCVRACVCIYVTVCADISVVCVCVCRGHARVYVRALRPRLLARLPRSVTSPPPSPSPSLDALRPPASPALRFLRLFFIAFRYRVRRLAVALLSACCERQL